MNVPEWLGLWLGTVAAVFAVGRMIALGIVWAVPRYADWVVRRRMRGAG